MYRALRGAVNHRREPSHEERAELAAASPATRAFLTVRLAEDRSGRRVTSAEIDGLVAETRAYADALAAVAEERRQAERGAPRIPFSLEELAAAADERAAREERDRAECRRLDALRREVEEAYATRLAPAYVATPYDPPDVTAASAIPIGFNLSGGWR